MSKMDNAASLKRSRISVAVALLGLISACDSALAPEPDTHAPSAGSSRSSIVVAAPRFTDRVILRDVRNGNDRKELVRDFRQALNFEAPETKRHLQASIDLLLGYDTVVTRAEVTPTFASNVIIPSDELPEGPQYISYINMSPDGGGGYSLAGTTYVQTEYAGAVIDHTMTYSVGSYSRTVEHSSGGMVKIHTTQAAIRCGEPTTVSADLVGTLAFNGTGGTGTSYASLGSRSCVPDEVDTTVPAPSTGGGGSSLEDEAPADGYTWCVVRTTYDRNTGIILSTRILYCY